MSLVKILSVTIIFMVVGLMLMNWLAPLSETEVVLQEPIVATNDAPVYSGVGEDLEPVESQNSNEKIIPRTVGVNRVLVQPLEELLAVEPNEFTSAMLAATYPDGYVVFSCSDTQAHALLLTAQYTQDDDGQNTYTPAVKAIENWEPDLLNDFGYLMFPGSRVPSQVLLFQAPFGGEHKVARATVEESTVSIYSSWLGNLVFYAPSSECLESSIELVYGSHGH